MGLPKKPVSKAYHNFVTVSIMQQSRNKQYNKMKTGTYVKEQHPNVLCL